MPSIDRVTPIYLGTDYQDNYPSVDHFRSNRTVKLLGLSSGHYGYPDFPPGRDVGGAFQLHGIETTYGTTGSRDHWRGGPNNQHYNGAFVANVTPLTMWNLSSFHMTEAKAHSSEAYAKSKPTKPDFSAVTSAGELREAPALLRGKIANSPLKRIGNFHLALQFGWLPLLADIRNLVQAQLGAQRRLAQLIRDNGRPVRRRVKIYDKSTEPSVQSGELYGSFAPVLVTQYYASQPRYRDTEYIRERCWGSSQWRYWLPSGPRDIDWSKNMMRRIMGSDISPAALYNLVPWSWLIDWFTNLGDLLENLDNGVADRVAAEYNYVMYSYERVRERHASGRFRAKNGETFSVSATSRSTAFIKTRTRGGPFDPSISGGDLNGKQLSILGALGLSRLP
nr:MAG: hypothetical protein 1 [Leviviridae sp.]